MAATPVRRRATSLRTSPLGSSADLAGRNECRVQLLREDIIALTDELVEVMANPAVYPVGSDRGTVYRALSTARFG